MTASDLIKACMKGDPKAEKQLFFRYAGKILTICRRYIPQESEAKDLMQECFIQIFEKIGLYDVHKGEFEGWLHQVCTNVVLLYLRKKKKSIPTIYLGTLPEFFEEIEETSFHNLSNESLLEGILELPEGYRQILNLYIFEGLSHEEISNYLNISITTSRSQFTRAKKLLKIILQKKIIKINSYHERRLA